MFSIIEEQLPFFTMVVYPVQTPDGEVKQARVYVIFYDGSCEFYIVPLSTVMNFEEMLKRGL